MTPQLISLGNDMITHWKLIKLFIIGLLLTTPSHSLANKLRWIDIEANYNNGFGYNKTVKPKIIRKATGYFFCVKFKAGQCNNPINKKAIDNLVQAVAQVQPEKLDVIRLGLSEEELKANANKALESKRKGLGSMFGWNCKPELCSGPVYEEIFLKNYSDLKVAQRWFEFHFQSYHTDDDPFLKLTLVFDSGDTWIIESRNQYFSMLPWTVRRSGVTFKTFAPEIPRALRSVLSDMGVEKWSDKKVKELAPLSGYALHAFKRNPYELWLDELLVWPVMRDMFIHIAKQTLENKMDFIQSHFDIFRLHRRDSYFSEEVPNTENWRGIWISKNTNLPLELQFGGVLKISELYKMAVKADKIMQKIDRTSWISDLWDNSKNQILQMQLNGITLEFKQSPILKILELLEANGFKSFAQKWTPNFHSLASMKIVHYHEDGGGIHRLIEKSSQFLILPSGEMIMWASNVDKFYKWNREKYGPITNTKRPYIGKDIIYLVRLSPKGEMVIQKPDPK